jgi:hypothetical protein
MLKKFSIFLLSVTVLYFVLGYFTNLRGYKGLPSRDLTHQLSLVSIDISALSEKADLKEVEKKRLFLLRGDRAKVQAEMFIRQFYIDQLATLLFIIALFMVAAGRLRAVGDSMSGSKDAIIRDMDVQIDQPGEEYVDEWGYQHRLSAGFPTKEEAIHWLKSDPMLKCGYCGAQLRSAFTGQQEAVRLITFYKEVPEGAKDLRVVLGSHWFAVHATQLRCDECDQIVNR